MSGCADCVAAFGGCCKTVFLDGWKIILLPGEIKRISELTGSSPSQFVHTGTLARHQIDWYISRYAKDDPLWVRLILQWKEVTGIKRSCPFLSSGGCSLPYGIKPFLCRVYPLEFNITLGTITLSRETNCPVAQEASCVQEVIDYFGDNWESLQRHFMAFRNEFLELLDTTSLIAMASHKGELLPLHARAKR